MRNLTNGLSALSKVTSRFLLIAVLALILVGTAMPAGAEIPAPQVGGELQLAPLNPEFLDYSTEPPEVAFGYRPPPVDLSHVDALAVQAMDGETLPSRFDWRDQGKVTPVKDQNPCGMCWAFGATTALESTLLMDGDAAQDFSEQSVGMCVDRSWFSSYQHADDPCNAGGWSWLAAEVFIKKGAVLETCSPYDTAALQCDGSCVCDSCPAIKKVDAYRLVTDDGSQINAIKNAVYNEGPVTVSYFHDDMYLYSDPTWGTIHDYYPNPGKANHLTSIVGWNDEVPHPNLMHGGTGAWTVKNSWGSDWGDNGYFYLAYNSSSAGEVAYVEAKDHEVNEELLYWDEAGFLSSVGYPRGQDTETAWMANVFTASQGGYVTHVDFWTTSSNAEYEITIWDGKFGSELAHQTGTCQELGYYSLPLSTPVSVPAGQQFTIGVQMTTPGFGYPIPVEQEISALVDPPIQPDVSFIRHTAADPWSDLADEGYNACLRARMGDLENTPPQVPSDPSPADGETDASINAVLSWAGGDPDAGDTVTYDVYLTAGDETPEDLVCNDLTAPSCDPGTLDFDTTYYWYVEATDSHATLTTGETWAFSTGPAPSNNPPYQPDNPTPPDGATNQDLNVDLNWSGGDPDAGDSVTYDVYLTAGDDTPDDVVCDDVKTTWCDPGTLDAETTYYWYVEATDSYAASAAGDTWDFTTGSAPSNNPPYQPDNPTPPDGATNQGLNVDLSWTGDDPDAGDRVTYDVYLEADDSTPQGIVCSDVTATFCDPGTLDAGTHYYWYVEATDRHDATATGDIWDFTTEIGSLVYLPLVLRRYPPIPDVPVLDPIDNPDGDGNYTVSWDAAYRADTYVLQEDESTAFSSPTTRYSGSRTWWDATGKTPGTYYYRVKARNTWGDSGWSNVREVTVRASGPTGVVNGDFEDGRTGWTEYSTHGWDVIVQGLPGGIDPHSGSWAGWLGGDSDEIAFVEQQLTVPPTSPYLAYWHWIASEDVCGYDFGGVVVNATVADQYDLCQSENTGGWVRHTVDLSAYAGQSISLQIRAETDSSLNSNLFVDDVSFRASPSSSEGPSQDADPGSLAPKSGGGGEQGLNRKQPAIRQLFLP